ncbi:L-serine ammonia-lyase, iron-sulfur-dependent subunit beta [Helicovermis profundi]|uniref:L-serine deaminase n=1 Tax=Helicovermis profundi TaxID=3065157 RepID=A0AAU9E1I2_9FIRM|nr:L-serine ammonia-lyase, iron-sulfur-dependent subunit beta [Clostridia bacterium S502]
MSNYSAFDVVGPIMIGPSSSHTAGASRIGYTAYKLVKSSIKNVEFVLHGSFARTYRGHGTDKAILAGVLGIREYDEKLRDSFQIAKDQGVKFLFSEDDLGDVHPNTVKIKVEEISGAKFELVGSSIGGGSIKIIEINGIGVSIKGEYPAIIVSHKSRKGMIAGFTKILTDHGLDILFMSFYKEEDEKAGLMVIEVDKKIQNEVVDEIKRSIEGIIELYLI